MKRTDQFLWYMVKAERFLIRIVYLVPELLWYAFDLIRWWFNPRSQMKKVRVRFLTEVEWGRVYYSRSTPRNISGFSVYLPRDPDEIGYSNDDEDLYDLNEVHIPDHSLAGKGNWEWISITEAREKGYVFDPAHHSVSDEYHMDESLDFEEYLDRCTNPEWISENVPDEQHNILADLGKDGIKARADAVTNCAHLETLIQRGALYRVTDSHMLDILDGYGLHDGSDQWHNMREENR